MIIGALLYNKSPENEEKTAKGQEINTLWRRSSNLGKPASATTKDKNLQTSSIDTTYSPKKNQGNVFAYNRQGGSYLKQGLLVVIVSIVAIIVVFYSIEDYNNWIFPNGLGMHNNACDRIDPNIVTLFNNTYGCRTNYDNLLLSGSKENYYAILPISSAFIGYASDDDNSLSQVVHKLKALEKDQRNKGLLIILYTKDKESSDTLIGHCLTLVTAIEAYKQQTQRTVIAFGETFMPKDYCIATGADKIYIGKTGTLTIPVAVVLKLYALQHANNQPLSDKAQLNVAKDGNNLVCGKYKVTPCQNDLGDNFKKRYQDPYIQLVTKRESSIQQQKYWWQNLFNNVVESVTKIALFAAVASSMSSSTTGLLEGITTTDAYRMGLVDDYKQKQEMIAALGYPVQECCARFPALTWKAKCALFAQPAIEVVFIKSIIDQPLLERITPLLKLLEKAKQVKGIILVIDSLGGDVDTSYAISTISAYF